MALWCIPSCSSSTTTEREIAEVMLVTVAFEPLLLQTRSQYYAS